MFEKEAEEYTRKNWSKNVIELKNDITCQYVKGSPHFYDSAIKQAYQNGAEFGYNKANEWHYPSKGEYPKECENVWCYCKGPGIKSCCVGHTIVGGDNKVRWWANNKTEELRVIAWKEIVLPELKESE